jgi:hypothetical protein
VVTPWFAIGLLALAIISYCRRDIPVVVPINQPTHDRRNPSPAEEEKSIERENIFEGIPS